MVRLEGRFWVRKLKFEGFSFFWMIFGQEINFLKWCFFRGFWPKIVLKIAKNDETSVSGKNFLNVP